MSRPYQISCFQLVLYPRLVWILERSSPVHLDSFWRSQTEAWFHKDSTLSPNIKIYKKVSNFSLPYF